ncbi:MAG: hypothetical protein KatS3mg031_1126 [Chitinophagales bacterium]|nr:MAG: hypothetical protein KatS3mg031_1126 [Chitinophagales bacterium]
MRILHVIPNLKKGGAERLTLDICNALSKKPGVDVAVITFQDANAYPFLSRNVTVKVIPARFIPSLSGRPTKQLDAYKHFLETFKPDIIHSHLFEAEMTSRQIIQPGVRYFSHLHDNMWQFSRLALPDIFSKKRLTALYEKRLLIRQYRQCDNRFIAISRHTADYFARCLPADLAGKIVVLHNAIDYQRFKGSPDSVPAKDYVRLITTGSLVDKKNQIFLIDVVHRLSMKGYNVYLDILGDGPNRLKIEERIRSLNLSDRILLHGNVAHVEDLLRQAHIYVHAALYEPFGLAIVEAMAGGLPCVMLDGGGNGDLAVEGKNCFMIKMPDAEMFAAQIERLVLNQALYKNMSAYANRFAMQFDIGQYTDKLLDIYRQN